MIPIFADRTRTPGHHVLLPQGRNEPSVGNAIELPRVSKEGATPALTNTGLSKERVEELTALARVSISAVRRRLAIHPATLTPTWAEAASVAGLVPAVLAGTWTEASAADQAAVAEHARSRDGGGRVCPDAAALAEATNAVRNFGHVEGCKSDRMDIASVIHELAAGISRAAFRHNVRHRLRVQLDGS